MMPPGGVGLVVAVGGWLVLIIISHKIVEICEPGAKGKRYYVSKLRRSAEKRPCKSLIKLMRCAKRQLLAAVRAQPIPKVTSRDQLRWPDRGHRA